MTPYQTPTQKYQQEILTSRFWKLETYSFILLLLGAIMNFYVILSNDNRMPVYDYYPNDPNYVGFSDKSEVRHAWLGDIFYIHFAIFSLGDLIAFTGVCLIIYNTFSYYKRKRKLRKNE